jgi:type I restriction-modification system DNA methylase subunit
MHAETLLRAYEAYASEPGLAAVATLADIAANGHSLNIPLYVGSAGTGGQVSLDEALTDLESAQAAAHKTRVILDAELAKWRLSA